MTTIINNRYQLKNKLGEGGMGVVYRAYDRLTGLDVALKQVTTPQSSLELLSRAPTDANPSMLLANEFRTLASMRHPHIISVLDYGFDAGLRPFFTMTLLEEALPVDKASEGLAQDKVINFLIHILQALTYLHRRGILHRDLKPGNVLVQDDKAYLLDFGLALDADYARTHADTAGTLAYIAPEVLQGSPPTVESDLYSFGVLAYELLTGQHPYDTSTQSKLIQDLLLKPITVDDIALDEPISMVITRLLSKTAADRYSTAIDVIRALCEATGQSLPQESQEIRESFLVAANFVGREDELSLLKQVLVEALQGKGSACLIGGESGVGKSRLMEELRTHALVKGVFSLRGQAVTGGGLPYQLWRETVRHLLLMVTVTDEEAFVLKTIVPDIAQLLSRSIPDFELDNVAIQKRLPLVIINLLTEASKIRPLLILLEDLQWAGESLDILKQLLTQLASHRILLVANYRSDESPHLLDELNPIHHMALKRLSEEGIRHLSASMLGEVGRRAEIVELIQRESEGNAFFIVEVVRTLAEDAGQLSAIGQVTLPAQIFAGGMQRIIKRRLEHLPDWAIVPMQIAAVYGRQIDSALIKHLLPELEIERWLNLASDAAVFTVIEDVWQFAHDKLREHVIDNLESDTKRAVHQQVAEAIETLHADELKHYAVQLVHHYGAAKITEKEAYYAVLASDTILDFNAREGRRYAERAIALKAYEQHKNPQNELARLHYSVGRASLSMGEYPRARENLDKSLAIYERVGDIHGAAIAKTVIGEWGYMTGQFEESIPLLEECVELLMEREDWYNAGFAYMNLGIIHAQQNDIDQSHSYFEICVEIMEKTGDAIVIAKSLNNLAIALEIRGQIDEAQAMHEKALGIRRSIKDKRGIGYSLSNLSALYQDKGQSDEARTMRHEALKLVREVGDQNAISNILDSLGLLEYHIENYDMALSYFQEAVEVGQKIKNPYLLNKALRHLGDTHKKLGHADFERFYYQSLKVVQNTGLIPDKLFNLFLLAEVHAERDNPAKSVEYLALILKNRDAYQNIEDVETMLEELKPSMDTLEYQTAYDKGQNQDVDALIETILQNYEGQNE